jgi:hypothetical protein
MSFCVRICVRPSSDVKTALERGMVLVASLWGSSNMDWLDGGCNRAYPRGGVPRATAALIQTLRMQVITTSLIHRCGEREGNIE